jgi:hypothetical protein
MSIEQFLYTWKKDSYDKIECSERDADGNPLHIRFFRKSKLILEIFIIYDENGEWVSLTSKIPEKTKEEKKVDPYK